MKLKEYTVREFRSIWDSGPVKVDGQTTCLVGKNEAGKTTLLTALYRTNPIIPADADITLGRHAVLVGPNNSGKTTIIEALALLFGRDPPLLYLLDQGAAG